MWLSDNHNELLCEMLYSFNTHSRKIHQQNKPKAKISTGWNISDIEQLIELFQNEPNLWDIENSNYSKKDYPRSPPQCLAPINVNSRQKNNNTQGNHNIFLRIF